MNPRVAGGDLVVVLSALQKCIFCNFVGNKGEFKLSTTITVDDAI